MQAIILAAGKGQRLGDITKDNTKCMVSVVGEKLIDRAIDAILNAGINRIILVVGYKAESLKNYINKKYSNKDIEFIFVENIDFDKTNNIYSLYLAGEYLVKDDTILLESDLIYDINIVKNIVESKYKDIATVAQYKSWMDGTVVTYRSDNTIENFYSKDEIDYTKIEKYFKTVNIYKLSKKFSKEKYFPFLKTFINVSGYNSYYESVLKTLLTIPGINMYAYDVGDLDWYEIDDKQDLEIANVIFSKGKQKYELLTSKIGGFWRYNKVLDFLYFTNPYFPSKKFIEKIKFDFENLLKMYPSGLHTQKLNVERIFNVKKDMLVVGNGITELINILGKMFYDLKGAAFIPSFNEYIRCFNKSNLTIVDNSKNDYKYNIKQIQDIVKTVNYVVLISPDDQSGCLIKQNEIISIIEIAKNNNCKVIVDESFIDFSKKEDRYTLLLNSILEKYNNLIVVKSISKSYGVSGLRLGILASSDLNIIKNIESIMPIWNINSFAEYYLQNYNIFHKTYISACDKIAEERTRLNNELSKINAVKVYDSNAGYILLDLKNTDSFEFCCWMLDVHNILIKNLKNKDGFFDKNFIRIAVRDTQDNDILIKAMKEFFQKNYN